MDDEPDEIGIPEWVVTFGDMMSLLLTFFIMLVSLSEIKEEETYQALVDSMQQQFGYQKTIDALTPGDAKPRSQEFSVLSTTGRAKKKDTAKGGVPQKAPIGEEPRVRIIRPGHTTAVGSVVYFTIGSDELTAAGRQIIQEDLEILQGKPQKIEVRGHTSAEYASRTRGTGEGRAIAFRRANQVCQFLVEQGIDEQRLRIAVAGASEPMYTEAGGSATARNPRVEFFLLDETVQELRGTADERKTRSSPDDGADAESDLTGGTI